MIVGSVIGRAEPAHLIIHKVFPAFCDIVLCNYRLVRIAKLALIIYINVVQRAGLTGIVFLYRFENLALFNLPPCPVWETGLGIILPALIATIPMIAKSRYRGKLGV